MAASSDPYPWQEPVSKPARGAFIVIEGLDRAGKTTQVKRLCDKLYAQGHNIKTIRFPGTYPFFMLQFFLVICLCSYLLKLATLLSYKTTVQICIRACTSAESLSSSIINLPRYKILIWLFCSFLCNVANPQFGRSLGLQTYYQTSLVLVNPNITD
jgi:hypothetical protein